MPYIYISAAHKSSGKTTVSIGLTAALAKRGLHVQTFKKGPDYIDPLWLTAASGNPCYNLDFYTMSSEEIAGVFNRYMHDADIGIIEGNKGLYDGLDLDGSNSNAALATQLDSPIVLVIDARGMTRGIAPLILGYQAFDEHIHIRGVILNKIGGSRHESKLRQVIEHYTDVKVVGAVHFSDSLEIDERHLGLIPSNEAEEANNKIALLANAVNAQVDVDAVLNIADEAPQLIFQDSPEKIPVYSGEKVKIGIPRDKAFGFYYPGDLQKMEEHGAQLVFFDSINDPHLPAVDGLFIGGGFPEIAMAELSGNVQLREEIKSFILAGGPVYAECGGLMYLAKTLSWNGVTCEMVGAVPGDAVMHKKPQGRGYVRLQETGHSPWPDTPRPGKIIAAHEFHYSSIDNLPQDADFAYAVKRGEGIDGQHDGFVYKNLLANYTHMRDVGDNHWTKRFIEHVRRCKAA